jgi:glycosyltransferase involved in cell wall biosynthesis
MKTAIIVPSRNRPHNIKELQQSLIETGTNSNLFVVVDDDDKTIEDYYELENNFTEVLTFERGKKGMADPLNKGARFLLEMNRYDYFIFVGDDHRPRTEYWDQIWRTNLDELGTGLVYGDDLLQRQNLPTAVGMTASIVQELGGMIPEGFAHLYLDNFWLRLGQDLNAIRYLPETVIEHLHPIAGKGEWDAGYQEVNSAEINSADAQAFSDYISSDDYRQLVERLSA